MDFHNTLTGKGWLWPLAHRPKGPCKGSSSLHVQFNAYGHDRGAFGQSWEDRGYDANVHQVCNWSWGTWGNQ